MIKRLELSEIKCLVFFIVLISDIISKFKILKLERKHIYQFLFYFFQKGFYIFEETVCHLVWIYGLKKTFSDNYIFIA